MAAILKQRSVIVGVLSVALLAFALPRPLAAQDVEAVQPGRGPAVNLGLAFVPNQGQFAPAVRVAARALGGQAFFTTTGVTLSLPAEAPAATAGVASTRHQRRAVPAASRALVRLSFDGANRGTTVAPLARQPGVVNYLLGDDPARWRTGVPTYASVVYRELYTGIDLRYDGTDSNLKATYLVASGADPGRIRWRYDGAETVAVDKHGRLEIRLAGAGGHSRTLVERAPVAWQDIAGRRVAVSVAFALAADGAAGFRLGAYNSSAPLVIDPTIEYSTYLGGSNEDIGTDIAVDGDGNVYVAGTTISRDFPATGAFDPSFNDECANIEDQIVNCGDLFVTKLNPAGTALVYSTYFGGSGDDEHASLAVDAQGNVLLAGSTASKNLPTKNALQPALRRTDCPVGDQSFCTDLFVAKLNPSGNGLVYSTYLGGSDEDLLYGGVAVDAAGGAYVTGLTRSIDFPLANPFDATGSGGDAFVAKIDANGSLAYSTYLGGSSFGTIGIGIAVDAAGSAHVTGTTESGDFPTKNALQPSCAVSANGMCADVFVTKLNPAGNGLVYSTFLGGGRGLGEYSSTEKAAGIAVDRSGQAYVAGSTSSPDFPLRNALQPECRIGFDRTCGEAFIAKLTTGGALVYSTYFGGSEGDTANDVAVNAAGEAYLSGGTRSSDLPILDPVLSSCRQQFGRCGDSFVAKLSADGKALRYSTYMRAFAIAAGGGYVYVTGSTDATLPTRNPLQPSLAGTFGATDAFVAKIADGGPNLSANPGFEEDADNNGTADSWSTNRRASRSADLVHSGSYAMRHRAADNASYSIYQLAPRVQAGQLYSFHAYTNIPATTDRFTFRFEVAWKNAAGTVLQESRLSSYSAATDGWDRVDWQLIAPAGATQATVRHVAENLSATVYVDDQFFGNYVTNSSFEIDANGDNRPDDWSKNSNVTRSNTVKYSGSYALRHQGTNASYGIYNVVYGIRPGAAYSVASMVNAASASSTSLLRIELAWKDSNGVVLRTVPLQQAFGGNGWQGLTTTGLLAPSGAVQATVRQLVFNLNGTIYVDDVVMTPD